MGEGGNVCHYHKAVLSYGEWLESLFTFFDFDAVIVLVLYCIYFILCLPYWDVFVIFAERLAL